MTCGTFAGTLAQNYSFDLFKKQTGSSGSLTNPLQYTARGLDIETGLYYYRARGLGDWRLDSGLRNLPGTNRRYCSVDFKIA
jgi:hypothetical protein